MTVAGKRVLITGAARGVGAGTARALAERGARLALVDVDADAVRALAAELGDEHAWFVADVTDQQAISDAVDAAAERFGGLDVVAANAGIASFGAVGTIDPEAWTRTVDINLTGVFRTAHAAVEHLAASQGYLLLVSSLAAFVPTMGFSAYGASKAGVESLANSLRIELGPRGIAVGSAHMSWIDTELVRDAQHDLKSFNEMLRKMPWPMHSITSLDACVSAFVRGIEGRKRRIYVPWSVNLMHLLRPITYSALVETAIMRVAAPVLPRLDAEIRALGRSLSERATDAVRAATGSASGSAGEPSSSNGTGPASTPSTDTAPANGTAKAAASNGPAKTGTGKTGTAKTSAPKDSAPKDSAPTEAAPADN